MKAAAAPSMRTLSPATWWMIRSNPSVCDGRNSILAAGRFLFRAFHGSSGTGRMRPVGPGRQSWTGLRAEYLLEAARTRPCSRATRRAGAGTAGWAGDRGAWGGTTWLKKNFVLKVCTQEYQSENKVVWKFWKNKFCIKLSKKVTPKFLEKVCIKVWKNICIKFCNKVFQKVLTADSWFFPNFYFETFFQTFLFEFLFKLFFLSLFKL